MRHFASTDYWEDYRCLPPNIRELADKRFALLKQVRRYWSVRVGRRYRALGVEAADGIVWFWIGKHSEYDQLVKR